MIHKSKSITAFHMMAIAIVAMFAVCATAFAQITVTNATFPVAGDTLNIAVDYSPAASIMIGPPGFGLTWDFTDLQADTIQNIAFRPASEGSVGVSDAELFAVISPTSNNYFYNSNDWEEYYKITSDRVEVLAQYGMPFDIVNNAVFKFAPPVVDRRAPVNFFDIHQISSSTLTRFAP